MRISCAATVVLMLALCPQRGFCFETAYNAGVESKIILVSTVTAAGQPVAYPLTRKPEVTAMKVVLRPGQETGWHYHAAPGYAYLISGELTVDYEGAPSRVFKAGEAYCEAVDTPHNGKNSGKEDTVLAVFFTGVQGQELSNTAQPPNPALSTEGIVFTLRPKQPCAVDNTLAVTASRIVEKVLPDYDSIVKVSLDVNTPAKSGSLRLTSDGRRIIWEGYEFTYLGGSPREVYIRVLRIPEGEYVLLPEKPCKVDERLSITATGIVEKTMPANSAPVIKITLLLKTPEKRQTIELSSDDTGFVWNGYEVLYQGGCMDEILLKVRKTEQ